MPKEGSESIDDTDRYRPLAAHEITRLLNRIGEQPELFEKVLPLVYDDLKRIGHNQRVQLGAGPTMQTTALVHEACLKMRDQAAGDLENRLHLKRLAAMVMRQLIFDYARRRLAEKRGGGRPHEDLDDLPAAGNDSGDMDLMLEIEKALERMHESNPRMSEAFTGRFFLGLTVDEIGAMLDVSRRTVTRDLTRARVWIKAELNDYAPAG
ncbi:MAG: ECF-type sigma factor [Wenzhouxiangellaceae bacterium]|nr:ECF-type sigma factor [Wenzhouxiangellaceae bacterium]